MLSDVWEKDVDVPVVVITRKMEDYIAIANHFLHLKDCSILHYFMLEEEGSPVMQSETNYPIGIVYHIVVLGCKRKYNVENMNSTLLNQQLILKSNSVNHYTCVRDEEREAVITDQQKQVIVSRSLSRNIWCTIFSIATPGMLLCSSLYLLLLLNKHV
jgi:hypothetical protein